MSATAMALAPPLLTTSIMVVDIHFFRRHKITVGLRVGFLSLDMSVGELGDRAESTFFLGFPSFCLDIFLFNFFNQLHEPLLHLVLSRDFFSTFGLTNLATGTVKEGVSTGFVATASTLGGTSTHLCTVSFIAN